MKYLRMMIIGLLISLSSSYVLVTLSVLSNNAVASGTELLEQIVIAAILGIAIGLLSVILIWSNCLYSSASSPFSSGDSMCTNRRLFW